MQRTATRETIALLGSGYVGLTTACGFAQVGYDVTGYDNDSDKVARMNAGHCPFYEPGLSQLLRDNLRARRLRFTTRLDETVARCQILMLALPTPPDADGQADLKILHSVVAEVIEIIRRQPPPWRTLMVTKSTVPPGTTEALARRYRDEPVEFASNPEFLKEGNAIEDFMRPDRVVVGVGDRETGQRLRRLYEPFVRNEHPVLVVGRTAAEMTKYAANIMLAGRISLLNELANLCRLLDVDVRQVCRGIGYDRRIGFSVLAPGIGYGGSCLPKDLSAMVQVARRRDYNPRLLQAIADVNGDQPRQMVQWIRDRLGPRLDGRTVAVWGLAFKPGSDDMREAPSLVIINALLTAGATVRVHDPVANESARRVLGSRVTYCNDPYIAATSADALVLCTEWPAFQRPDLPRLLRLMGQPIIFDGRAILEPATMRQSGFEYHAIGRPSVAPAGAPLAEPVGPMIEPPGPLVERAAARETSVAGPAVRGAKVKPSAGLAKPAQSR